MAILNANDAAHTPRPPLKPTSKPALFVHSLVPKAAVQRSISCCLLPSLRSARQLVVATDTTLHLHVVDDYALSLTPLTDLILFTRIHDIAAVSSQIPGCDVLVVLTDASHISFMQFDEPTSRLRCSGAVSVNPPASFSFEATIRRQARLLATHPRKRMVAVASLQSVISVFPILFLPEGVNAGKIATVAVDGVILSLDFLEDEEGVPGDAILIALLQKGKEQVIALYTVGVPDVVGGLSVTFVGSMITCASHPDDVAVARATSKLTGESIRPTPPATAVTRLSGCPFLFAVFVRGRIIAGDARSVIVNARSGESLPLSVRIAYDIMLPSAVSQEHTMEDASSYDDASSSQATNLPPSVPGSSFLTPSSSGVGFEAQDGFVTPTQTPTNRALGDPPSVTMPSRRARRGGRDDIPPLPSLSRRISSSRSPYTGQGERNLGEDLLSYLFVPAYISLDVGEGNGTATAWVDARDHFSDENGDGNGLYFAMESGAMFVLRWSDSVREGTATFRIPGGERTRTAPRRNFSVEFIGDVGPAVSITSLDRRLLYIANDCADGSLRQLHVPQNTSKRRCRPSLGLSDMRPLRAESLRYGLEVRQEFLNMSPISDFVLAPPQLQPESRGRIRQQSTAGENGNDRFYGEVKTFSQAEALKIEEAESVGTQSAFEHVIYGGKGETEIIACSGMGRYGCIRLIRPGAPVSLLASSDGVFTACNETWPLRFAHDSKYDAGLVLTFAQTTTVLLAVPPSSSQQDVDIRTDSSGVIGKLVDGTRAVGLVPDCRTIAVSIVDDGIIAQVHEQGVRLSYLEKEKNLELSECLIDGVFIEPLYRRVEDWSLPEGGIISMAAAGHGHVLLSVISGRKAKPSLCLLRFTSSTDRSGLEKIASLELDQEISCVEIPNWPSLPHGAGVSSRRPPPVALVGTYAPSLEIRSLDASLRRLGRRALSPWSATMMNDYISHRNRKPGHATREASGLHAHRRTSLEDMGKFTRTDRAKARSDHMTAVPESVCGRIVDGQKQVLAGLRDGSVMCLSVIESASEHESEWGLHDVSTAMSVDAHRKLGHRPVTLKAVMTAIGAVILAQSERSWIGITTGSGIMEWIPLAFPETRSMCSFSVYGAERCVAAVASDNALYICALRQKSRVSVSSFLVGATPRRVLAMSSPQDCIVVATCSDPGSSRQKSAQHASSSHDVLASESSARGPVWQSEVRVYDRRNRGKLGALNLLPGELVHVLVNWLGFLVVGTSWGIQEASAQRRCNRGRLLLYSLRHAHRRRKSVPRAKTKIAFSLCSEVVLPGAVLAGTPHPSADIFVASCNEEVIVFAVPKSRTALVELARISARTLVVSISLKDDIVCVVDRKDSVSFFQLHSNSGRLVRDRSDYRRRILSDALLVDRTLAIAVDRHGGMLSIGYEEGDAPAELAIVWPDGSEMSSYLQNSPDQTISDYNPSGTSTGEAQPVAGLSTEFDMVHLDSGSDQSMGSNEHNDQAMGMFGETNSTTSGEVSEQGNAVISDDTGNSGMFGDDNGGSEDSMDGVGEQGGETDEANPAQSADDGMMIAVDEGGNEGGVESELGGDSVEAHIDARQAGMPKNLVCHHNYNLNDTALRIRSGEFVRFESRLDELALKRETGSGCTIPHERFIGDANTGVFCGTLGGAIVVGVPMSPEAYEVLSEVERELGENIDIMGAATGCSHKTFRSAYGDEAMCCVDGDVVKLYSGLDKDTKREIASVVGFYGDKGVLRIQGMIDELFDRVG